MSIKNSQNVRLLVKQSICQITLSINKHCKTIFVENNKCYDIWLSFGCDISDKNLNRDLSFKAVSSDFWSIFHSYYDKFPVAETSKYVTVASGDAQWMYRHMKWQNCQLSEAKKNIKVHLHKEIMLNNKSSMFWST